MKTEGSEPAGQSRLPSAAPGPRQPPGGGGGLARQEPEAPSAQSRPVGPGAERAAGRPHRALRVSDPSVNALATLRRRRPPVPAPHEPNRATADGTESGRPLTGQEGTVLMSELPGVLLLRGQAHRVGSTGLQSRKQDTAPTR